MKHITLALGAVGAMMLATPVAALADQEVCGPRAQIVDKLAHQFKESQQAVGLVNDKAVLEIYVSSQGTWTIIATGTDGNSCLLSAGKDWEGANFIKGLDTSLRAPATAAPALRDLALR